MKLENIKQIYNNGLSFDYSCNVTNVTYMPMEELMKISCVTNAYIFYVDYESEEKLRLRTKTEKCFWKRVWAHTHTHI